MVLFAEGSYNFGPGFGLIVVLLLALWWTFLFAPVWMGLIAWRRFSRGRRVGGWIWAVLAVLIGGGIALHEAAGFIARQRLFRETDAATITGTPIDLRGKSLLFVVSHSNDSSNLQDCARLLERVGAKEIWIAQDLNQGSRHLGSFELDAAPFDLRPYIKGRAAIRTLEPQPYDPYPTPECMPVPADAPGTIDFLWAGNLVRRGYDFYIQGVGGDTDYFAFDRMVVRLGDPAAFVLHRDDIALLQPWQRAERQQLLWPVNSRDIEHPGFDEALAEASDLICGPDAQRCAAAF